MKKDKIEIIRQESSDKKCYICKGKNKECKTCDGTGIFKDNHYILIANGMAFSMDTIK